VKNRFFLSIGSNKGNRFLNIYKSKKKILKDNICTITKCSHIYETEPMYCPNQNKFLNLVLECYTNLDPLELLKFLKLIERKIGRNFNAPTNSSRVIDLDILTYNNSTIKSLNLTIPHPRIVERAFVLIPWNDISPNYILKDIDKTIANLLSDLNIKDNTIKLYKEFL